jgi:hypothetical protein
MPRSPLFCITTAGIPLRRSPATEPLLSAIASDLVGRALSMAIQRYRRFKTEETEQNLRQLRRVLLRIDATVEEAEGRYNTNQAMLRQLEMLSQGMYEGYYMLDTIRYRGHGEDEEVSGGLTVALHKFSPAKLFFPFHVARNTDNMRNTAVDAENMKKLEKMLNSLDTLMGDTKEFTVFLNGYPRISRQPYSTYMILKRSCSAGRWRRTRSSTSCSGQKLPATETQQLPALIQLNLCTIVTLLEP